MILYFWHFEFHTVGLKMFTLKFSHMYTHILYMCSYIAILFNMEYERERTRPKSGINFEVFGFLLDKIRDCCVNLSERELKNWRRQFFIENIC